MTYYKNGIRRGRPGRPKKPKPKGEGKLTPKRRKFIRRYLVHFNKTRAAEEVGYSKGTAQIKGYQLSVIPVVKAEIERLLSEQLQRQDLTAERTLEEIRRLMTSDITNYFDEDGKLLNLKDLPEEMRACIASVKMKDGEISEIKLWPKPHAIHLAATHLRLLAELREQRTSLEERIRQMTTEQRRQYAIELLGKARSMLPLQLNEGEYEVLDNGIGGPAGGIPEAERDGDVGEV